MKRTGARAVDGADERTAVSATACRLAAAVADAMRRDAETACLDAALFGELGRRGLPLAATLHRDRDARAALALALRSRRETQAELHRAFDDALRFRKVLAARHSALSRAGHRACDKTERTQDGER